MLNFFRMKVYEINLHYKFLTNNLIVFGIFLACLLDLKSNSGSGLVWAYIFGFGSGSGPKSLAIYNFSVNARASYAGAMDLNPGRVKSATGSKRFVSVSTSIQDT